MSLKVLSDKTADLFRTIELATKGEVLVGIPSNTAERNDDAPINNAALGYIFENGSPAANIPARPHLVPGVEAVQKEIAEHLGYGLREALAGRAGVLEKSMNIAGQTAVNSVRAKINAGVLPALADSTIAARLRRGRTGTVPMIDTGQLRNSYTYVIREKK